MANWWLGNSSAPSRLRVKGETILIIFGERGGGEKTRAKNMSGVFCVLNIFKLWCLRILLFQFEKTGWVLTKTSSRSIVLHRCLQLFVRFLGIWNKWCDIIDTISNGSREISRHAPIIPHCHLLVASEFGKLQYLNSGFMCCFVWSGKIKATSIANAILSSWSYVFTMDSQISSEFPVHDSRKAISLYW